MPRSVAVHALVVAAVFVLSTPLGVSALGAFAALGPAPPINEVAVLAPQTGQLEPRFGRAVALADTAAIVASPPDGDDGTADGSVHVFGDSKSGWRRVQRLTAVERDAQDRFGQSVAGDGARIVIGRDRADEAGVDAGAAVVLRRVGYHYRVEAALMPESPNALAGFGSAVAIDGVTIVVGASRDNTTAVDAGSVGVFTLAEKAWKPTTTLLAPDGAIADWFGHAVSVSGSTIAIGAYGDDDRGEKCGSVYMWTRNPDGWSFVTKLVPDQLQPGDWFGYSCAIDGNLLAVGAPRDDKSGESAGSVRIFRRTRGEWNLEAILRPEPGSVTTWFGYAVAFDGGRLLVGAPGDDTDGDTAGAAYLYRRSGEVWTLAATLLPSSPVPGAQFGSSVALHDDLALVGRNWDEDAEQVSGNAWIFRLTPSDLSGHGNGGAPSTKPSIRRGVDVDAPPSTIPDSSRSHAPAVEPREEQSPIRPRISTSSLLLASDGSTVRLDRDVLPHSLGGYRSRTCVGTSGPAPYD